VGDGVSLHFPARRKTKDKESKIPKNASPQRAKEKRTPTHQIKINTMIHQIIHPRLYPGRRAEIDPILLAHIFHLLPRPRQAHNPQVKLAQVVLQHGGGVAGGVARDEEG